MHSKFYTILILMIVGMTTVRSQTPSDAIMMTKGQFCLGVVYEHSWFDEYWEGTKLRTNGTIATVNRNSVNAMVAVGLFDRLNLLVGVPYVSTNSTEPNGGYFAGASGFSDLNLAIKGTILDKPVGAGNLALLGTIGFSTPMSDYLSDYRPYSIGFGANELTFRGILQYRMNSGFFARGAFAYLWRGQTEAERDYYYNNGSFYSARMDVPSAVNYNAVAGVWLLDNALKVEAQYMGIACLTGDDIRPYNAAQPTNKASFSQVGASAQVHLNKPAGLGAVAYYSQTLTGRNIGKSQQFGAGLLYLFNISKNKSEMN